MKSIVIIFFVSILYFFELQGQPLSFYRLNQKNYSDTHSLDLSFTSASFLKNNEYFNNLHDGITYLGTWVNPELDVTLSKSLIFSAGWYFQLFSGREKPHISTPTLGVQWQFLKDAFLKIGNFKGSIGHQLIEPLYSYDSYYLSNSESGIQVLITKPKLFADVWLNWQKFILPGDNFKEEFVIGTNIQYRLNKISSPFSVKALVYAVGTHKGGQVETAGGHLQTIINSATGLHFSYKYSSTDSIGLSSQYCTFIDGSPYKQLFYSKGWGSYSMLFASLKNFNVEAGFWHGRHYISSKGEMLFQSVSEKYTVYWEPNKDLIISRLSWSKSINHKAKVGLGGGVYYDLLHKNIDFYYQFHLIIQFNTLLKQNLF